MKIGRFWLLLLAWVDVAAGLDVTRRSVVDARDWECPRTETSSSIDLGSGVEHSTIEFDANVDLARLSWSRISEYALGKH